MGTLYALLTPPVLAVIACLCALPLGVLGLVVAGVGIAYLVNRFARWYLATWGSEAFEYYKKSAGLAFLFVPAVAVAICMLQAEKVEGDEGAGMLFLVLAFGFYFLSILLAAAWLAGVKWAGGND
jgi:hypothetical protein